MGLDGLSPLSDTSASYRIETKTSAAKPAAKTSHDSSANPVDTFRKLVDENQGKDRFAPSKTLNVEHAAKPADQENDPQEAAASEKQTYQTSQEVVSLEQSILEAQRQLAQEEANQAQDDISVDEKAFSYWDRLDVMEKAQKINQLKSKISSMELERAQLVASLKEQVSNGSYQASGTEILDGMLKEFF